MPPCLFWVQENTVNIINKIVALNFMPIPGNVIITYLNALKPVFSTCSHREHKKTRTELTFMKELQHIYQLAKNSTKR